MAIFVKDYLKGLSLTKAGINIKKYQADIVHFSGIDSMTTQTHDKLYFFLICLALIVSTFIAYEPMRHNDFVEYDDNVYITENLNVRGGLTLDSVIWAFTQPHAHMWHPLTTLSHILDCQIFGLNPFWHHFVSLLFHTASALLLFWILSNTTGKIWPSAFAAAVFALHPLGVESVAWAAERKTVLSGLFWFLTIAAYVWYTKRPGIKRYILLFGVYTLCIMTKPIVAPLPLVLLLLDYWPLGRCFPEYTGKNVNKKKQWVIFYRLVREKIPLFILSAILCAITFFAQRSSHSMAPAGELSAATRLSNAFISCIKYIEKIFWPENLALLYPYLYNNIPARQVFISVLLLLAISIFAACLAKRHKYLPTGWLWYLVTLIPVIGIVQVGMQAMADRYTYLPAIGIFIIAAWGASEISNKLRLPRMWLRIPAVIALAALLICTRMQVQYWRNTESLYKHSAEATENNFSMQTLYGNVLNQKGEYDKAIEHFN